MRFDRIQKLLKSNFPDLTHLEISDESHMHAGRQGQESHFKILLVAPVFDGETRVMRQRKLNQLFKEEFEKGLHALTMRLLTPEEFAKQDSVFKSPDCKGGN